MKMLSVVNVRHERMTNEKPGLKLSAGPPTLHLKHSDEESLSISVTKTYTLHALELLFALRANKVIPVVFFFRLNYSLWD